MLVPLSWLRDFAPIDLDGRALAEVFDDLGMVVEAMRTVGEGLDRVVVARVEEIHPIPGADKIRRVVVDGGEAVEVVCGAWNFTVGDLVPLARVGAVLSGGFAISQRRMKGIDSHGMLCSPAELGLGDDAGGILVLDPGIAVGTPLADALGLDRDTVYDLAIEGNRPDAMCVAGVARDTAARLRLAFAPPAPPPLAAIRRSGPATPVSAVVESPDLCPRFTALALEGVTVTESPAWIAHRLTLAGMRALNSVVDASNYVMLELGQPTHPYDLDRIEGPGFVVRAARPGEEVETLDGAVRRTGDTAPVCLICDSRGAPIGIGGVMGGASSEISTSTTRIVLEAANFAPLAIARAARHLALRTEASARFERGVDLEGIERAVARFCEILALTSPDLRVLGDLVDVRSAPSERRVIRLRTARTNAVLGADLDEGDIAGYLAPIGFNTEPAGDGALDVTVASFRPDVAREIDLIEEVARHHGYRNIARTVPVTPQVGRLTPAQRDRRTVRATLAGLGFSEAVCAQLLGPGDHSRAGLPEDAIAAVDPLAREESLLRTSLLPGMLRAVAFNTDRRNGDLGMFEIGHTFRRPDPAAALPELPELPEEREMLGVVVAGAGLPGVGSGAAAIVHALRSLAAVLRLDGFRMRATTAPGMHPGRTAAVWTGGTCSGHAGEVDPDVSTAWGIDGRIGWAEVDLDALLASPRRSPLSRAVSRYPSTDIDLAFVVTEEIPAADVEATLVEAAGDLLERVALFDVYRGGAVPEGTRSLAYRLRFCAPDRTLTDEEVADRRHACIEAVASAHGGRLR